MAPSQTALGKLDPGTLRRFGREVCANPEDADRQLPQQHRCCVTATDKHGFRSVERVLEFPLSQFKKVFFFIIVIFDYAVFFLDALPTVIITNPDYQDGFVNQNLRDSDLNESSAV